MPAQQLPDIVAKTTRDMLGHGRAADENDILQTAHAVQQLRDPNGPHGDEYLQLQYFCADRTDALLRRILRDDKEIGRLKAELAELKGKPARTKPAREHLFPGDAMSAPHNEPQY